VKTLLWFAVVCAGCGGEAEIVDGLIVSVTTNIRIERQQVEVARLKFASSLPEDVEVDEASVRISDRGAYRNFRLFDSRRRKQVGKSVASLRAGESSVRFSGLFFRVPARKTLVLKLLADIVRPYAPKVREQVELSGVAESGFLEEASVAESIRVPGACAHYARQIRSRRINCEAGPPMPSPTGRSFSCNYHTSPGGRGDPRIGAKSINRVISLDIPASFGEIVRAPVAGQVELDVKFEEDCVPGSLASCGSGNRVIINFGDGFRYTIVHVFDFLAADGAQVNVGDPIASVGGQCCREYNTRDARRLTGWRGRDGKHHYWSSTCNYAPPFCAPPWEAGNSVGPHLHVSITKNGRAIPILPCFEGVGLN